MVKTRRGTDTNKFGGFNSIGALHGTGNLDLNNTNTADSTSHSMATASEANSSHQDQTFSLAPPEPPLWFLEVRKSLLKIDSIDERLANIENKLQLVESDIASVKVSVNFACEEAKQATTQAKASEETCSTLKNENGQLRKEICELRERLVQQESQARRNNLLFNGIQEKTKETWSETETAVREVLSTVLGLDQKNVKFERVHRIGQKHANKTRSILAKFCYFQDREQVWGLRKKLSGTVYTMSEDFPPEIIQERRTLFPVLKAAKASSSVKNVQLKVDKLLIDGKTYTSKSLNDLPAPLKPKNFSTKRINGVSLFASKHSLLSNFFTCEPGILIDMKTYCSTEQYFQSEKAIFFKDEVTTAKIMAEKDPYKIHSLGKIIRNSNETIWALEAYKVLLKCNIAKFTQHREAREALLETGTDSLGEATLDPTFGIGLTIHDSNASNKEKWTGKNIFGQVLEQVRAEIQKN